MPVVVEGVTELKRALKQYAPDLRKQMDAEIRVALKDVVNSARAKVPPQAPGNLYNWNYQAKESVSRTSKTRAFPLYNSSLIRKGIVYKMGRSKRTNSGFASLYSLLNKDAVGAIIETAGRVHPQGRPQKAARQFGQSSKNFGQSNNPNAGSIFTGRMNAVGVLKSYDNDRMSRGRLLIAAYAEKQGKTLDAVMKAIDKASRQFNERVKTKKVAA